MILLLQKSLKVPILFLDKPPLVFGIESQWQRNAAFFVRLVGVHVVVIPMWHLGILEWRRRHETSGPTRDANLNTKVILAAGSKHCDDLVSFFHI